MQYFDTALTFDHQSDSYKRLQCKSTITKGFQKVHLSQMSNFLNSTCLSYSYKQFSTLVEPYVLKNNFRDLM